VLCSIRAKLSLIFRPEIDETLNYLGGDYMAASLFKRIFKHCLATFMVFGLAGGVLAVVSVNAASATSIQQEGQDGNNLVCGGVHTLAKAIYIARGGSVRCANGTVERGIGKIWAAMGMTLPVIERMKLGTVCANQGYISSGRQMGPDPSKNVRREVDGQIYYSRPLSVWGPGCYQAFKGHTEDGQSDAILTGCGNGETTRFPPSTPAPVKAPVKTVACYLGTTPEYSVPAGYTVESGVCVNVQQECATDNGNYDSVTGICTIVVATCSNVNNVPVTGSNDVVYITNYGNCNTTPPVVVVTPPPVVVPPPPPVVTPPSPPTVQILTQPQEVSISGTLIPGSTPFKADVSAPSGATLNVVFSAQWGSFPTSSFTYGGGMNQVNTTYDAPSELPPLSTINGVSANWDTVTVTVYETYDNTSTTVSANVSFPILPATTTSRP
jgi:hypothetical protein